MREAVEERGRQLLVARKHGDPLGKGQIGRDDRGASLVSIGDEIEEQLAADAIERDKSQFVDDEHVDAKQPLLEPRELAGITRLEQLPHQIGRAPEQDAVFLFRRFDAPGDR